MVTGANESRSLVKYALYNCRCRLDGKRRN